jgi:hypothetical protein
VRNAVALRGLLEESLPAERVDLGGAAGQRAGADTYA